MLLAALAVAPGIAVCLFIYSLNKYGKEHVLWLVLCFLLGMAATLPALLVQTLAVDVRNEPYRPSGLSVVGYAFVIVALSEEGSKFLVFAFLRVAPFDVQRAFRRHPVFGDDRDGVCNRGEYRVCKTVWIGDGYIPVFPGGARPCLFCRIDGLQCGWVG